MKVSQMKTVMAATLVTLAAGLSACGGSGSEGKVLAAASNPRQLECVNTPGQFDLAQSALAQNAAPAAAQLPVGGVAARDMTESLAWLIDSLDGLTGGLQKLAATQDPNALLAGLQATGNSILCSTDRLSTALIALNLDAAKASAPLPVIPQVLDRIVDVQMAMEAAYSGAAPGGNLTALTGSLRDLALSLQGLSAQLPALPGSSPYLSALPGTLSGVTYDLAQVLDSTGRLDAAGTASAISTLLTRAAVPYAFAGGIATGLPPDVLLQSAGALGQVRGTFNSGLGLVLDPLFRALSAVLAPVMVPQVGFSAIVSGGLAGIPGTPATGSLSQLLALLPGGGIAPSGLSIGLLGDLLNQLMPGLLAL